MKLNEVTLVIVDGVEPEKSVQVLEYSSKNIDFDDIKIISFREPENLTNNIIFHQIDKLDYIGYNKFIIYELYKYINTNFVLLIQTDGFVVNPDAWMNEFYNYDYIGAPFPLPLDSFSYRDINGEIFRVGNGGFSFRSKKLLQIPTVLKLKWEPFHGFYNEDGFICGKNRQILIENGIKFAPLDVAKYFSREITIPENVGLNTFGFHKWRDENIKYPKF